MPDLDFTCYSSCNNLIENCLEYNDTYCFECDEHFVVDDKFHENKSSIYSIDPWDFNDKYWGNLDYIKIVDHYIGNNFTIIAYVYSECTEDLLNRGNSIISLFYMLL